LPTSWWISLAIAVLGVCASLAISYYVELNRQRSAVESNLKFWSPELADIFSHQDWLRLSKLGKAFVTPTTRLVTFREGDRPVFSFPIDIENISCAISEHHSIEQYSAKIGNLDICHDPFLVLSRAIESPFFVIVSLSLFFSMLFAALLPMMSHRKGLMTLVDYLADWSRSADSIDSLPKDINSYVPRDALESKLHSMVQEFVQKRIDFKRKELRDEIVRDVAHNVNSPIASLAVHIQKAPGLTEHERQSLQDCLSQLSGIVSKLKGANPLVQRPIVSSSEQLSASAVKVEKLSILLETILNEKRLEKGDISEIQLNYEICESGYGAFAAIHSLDFKVVISNILNNAYEAIQRNGRITVKLTSFGSSVQVIVEDTGSGIPGSIQAELFREGFTYGKSFGNGRGLFHAKKTVMSWNGDIALESKVGSGTRVTISLPCAEPPLWFLPSLDMAHVKNIVLLDDDPSIFKIWQYRLQDKKIVYFSESDALAEWLYSNPARGNDYERSTIFLVDLRLGTHQMTGLDVIERFGIAEDAVLVTSDAGQEGVQKRCSFLGAKLLWKGEIELVPVVGLRHAEILS
jgi:signal transduction histidine kinase